jgi:hypothetical protein
MERQSGEATTTGGHEHWTRRSGRQAAFFGDLTEDLLRRAGIVQGMRVLDIGCDAGDVSLLTARLVGPTFDYGQGGRETLRTVERTLSKL